jgi:hypothetical protein
MEKLLAATTKLAVCLLLLSAPGPAGAAAQDTCAKAYETAQELRADGLLRAARDVLRMCVRQACQPFIRNDCIKWLGEVDLALPSVVFAVRMAGRDLEQVTVSCDEELLVERLDGRAVPLDPGKHSCRFESAGAHPGQIEVLIAEGHKNRVIQVDLQPLAAPAPPPALAVATPATLPAAAAAAVPAAAPSPDPPTRSTVPPPAISKPVLVPGPAPLAMDASRDPRKRLTVALAAASVAGVGSFVALGLRGLMHERDLSINCAPACPTRDVRSIRTNYLLADIGLGVGLVSAAAAAYLVLTDKRSPSSDRSSTALSLVRPVPLADGGALTVGSSF